MNRELFVQPVYSSLRSYMHANSRQGGPMLRRVSDLEGDYLNNLRGINLYGLDNERLGVVDDALVDDTTGDLRYLLVDSDWMRSHHFLVPAEQVFAYRESEDLYANLRRADVESLPELRHDTLLTSDAFARYET